MGYADFVAKQDAQGGSGWSHPTYARSRRRTGGGPISVAKTLLKGALKVGKSALRGIKKPLTHTIVNAGSDILLKRKSPKRVLKRVMMKEGKALVNKGLRSLKKELFKKEIFGGPGKKKKNKTNQRRRGRASKRYRGRVVPVKKGRKKGGSGLKNKKQTIRSKSNQRGLLYTAMS